MSVLERSALEESPLADLHAIASELSIDGYRRLRKEQLIDAILASQGGQDAGQATETASAEEEAASGEQDAPARRGRRRGRRGGRSRGERASETEETEAEDSGGEAKEEPEASEDQGSRQEDEIVEGEVELVPNGAAFLRVNPPENSDDDIYISAAQVKRCDLISGDRISGPRRPARRSERFASLYRIDTVNGRPAAELADGVRFDDLPAVFASERFALDSGDETLKAIDSVTPIGKGSRVVIAGGARAGKTEALRRLAAALAKLEDLRVFVVLSGVRPEEVADWRQGGVEPAQSTILGASADAQAQAVGSVIDQARRIAARGGDVAVLLDTLDGLSHQGALRALGSARKIADGGSLTVIATASEPFGGETTVIALDAARAGAGQFPALDVVSSGTIRPELLVGEDGAAAIVQARREAASQ
jgi:transcription termination factor Rho